ncbi:MAG: hypothetical protein WD875_04990 [Pirellulales bacterium]
MCDLAGRGLVGGYLLLNAAGRPLEFHCTAPVRPSRAQEILYGPTLQPFLYGEQIGRALLEKTTAKPVAVFVDAEALLAAQAFVDAPLAVVHAGDRAGGDKGHGDSAMSASGAIGPPKFHCFRLNDCTIALPAVRRGDEATIVERITSISAAFDLAEPFERIREAVGEAHRDATTRTTGTPVASAVESVADAA